MARVTEEEVIEIMDTTLEEDDITPFITGANVFVTNVLGTSLDDSVLKEIERWLAAHMVSLSKEREIKEAAAGGASVKYTGYWTVGLKSTSYGQMAIALDSSGELEKLAGGKKAASIYVIPSFDD